MRTPSRADGVQVDDIRQIRHVGVEIVVPLRDLQRAGDNGTRFTARIPSRRISLARLAITLVASVSAGPPLGGLYLDPPSRGGLCDRVTTMPSARSVSRPRLKVRMAWLTAGVGV